VFAAIQTPEDVGLKRKETPGPVIESDSMKLKMDTGDQLFEITDKSTGEVRKFGFEMRYWKGYSSSQASGVYIFRP
jgi:hypothetical protein